MLTKENLLSVIKSPFIWGLIFIHLSYLILILTGTSSWYTPDSMEYIYSGYNLQENGVIYSGVLTQPIHDELYSLRPPLYGFIILLLFLTTQSMITILVVQNLVCILMWWYLAKLLLSFEFKPIIVHTAILISLLLFPSQLILANQVMADIWMEVFFFAAFYQFVRFCQNAEFQRILYANLFLALALLCKPTLLFFWIPSILFSFYLFIRSGNSRTILYALIVPAIVFIWSWRNETHTGHFHYSSITNQAMLEANVQSIYTAKYNVERGIFMHDSLKKEASKIASFKDKSAFIFKEGKRIIAANLPLYVFLFGQSNVNMFLTPGRWDMNMFFNVKPKDEVGLVLGVSKNGWKGVLSYFAQLNLSLYLLLGLVFIWNIFLLVSIGSFLLKKDNHAYIRLFVFVSIVYLCLATGLFSFARFKLMVFPLMVFTVPFFINRFRKNVI